MQCQWYQGTARLRLLRLAQDALEAVVDLVALHTDRQGVAQRAGVQRAAQRQVDDVAAATLALAAEVIQVIGAIAAIAVEDAFCAAAVGEGDVVVALQVLCRRGDALVDCDDL